MYDVNDVNEWFFEWMSILKLRYWFDWWDKKGKSVGIK